MKHGETIQHYQEIVRDQSGEYGDRLDPNTLHGQAWLLEELNGLLGRFLPSKAGTLVDLGCGTGWCMPSLRQFGGNIVGIDISRDMLDIARRFNASIGQGRGTAFIQYDGNALPFKDGSVDGVFLWDVMHHIECLDAVLLEVGRVLKPGGVFLGLEPNVFNPLMAVYHARREHERGAFTTNRLAIRKRMSKIFTSVEVHSNNTAISYNNAFYRFVIKLIDPVFTKAPVLKLFSLRYLFVVRKKRV
jgi:ubiquinone/menaquinone biosynthesis C-methylase UbiE